MNLRNLKVTGAWFQVGGNLIAAIGTTRGFVGEEDAESELVIVGSSLQALGYILQLVKPDRVVENIEEKKDIKSEEEKIKKRSESLEKTGIELLALGNVSNVIGTFFNRQRKMKGNDYLIITGNSLQSVGAFLGVEAALLNKITDIPWLIVFGNSLQSLGAGMQAYQGIHNISKGEKEERGEIDKKNLTDKEKEEEGEDERLTGLIGIWIQAIGTLISAIGLTEIETENKRDNLKIDKGS
ncbi:AraC family transcriptional regulator [Bacillus pseudomycoides]|uniref:AraC family transcriptional regulator n=1 Tax=Bacillus pseudomycoides TaxID=64104 RepID=A0AA91ZSC3_9BACI|nr:MULTISPECIES: AraC family transcriptional regulator [Bacillus]PEB48627.1 AraC family transcriptional regulator [Bacillus sp. AFS098217]PED81580.1 AraC family transcriptional regulator [Bacillus pseudomycoides]PEU07505.1 AraC family transcriptional regulator [Bacillus sp. AFS019443]PEU08505.1 AraC family transcriptional regulator [Bacillus sp. AFS014408]PFW62241.1 AraC family transcriptional regulator [Bacillus sp. AFS075034]